MSKRTIYLLELEQGKYFLLAREPPVDYPNQILVESVLKYGYLKKFKPLKLIDQWPENHPLDLDIHVKKQMLVKGIDNVRGGSYLSTDLTPEQLSFLTHELFPFVENPLDNPPDDTCPDIVIKELLDYYDTIPLTQIPIVKNRVEKDYATFLRERDALANNKIDIKCARSELEWLLAKCREQVGCQKDTIIYRLIHTEDVRTYRNVLNNLHKIYKIFHTLYNRPFDNPLHYDLPLDHPEFLLDDFIYHGNRTHLPVSVERMERLYNAYSFFLTYIENRLLEMRFDVASWGPNAIWRFPREIYLLSNKGL
jgi:hypothetical protein